MDDVLAQYPDAWNLNNFAYFSCLAGDQAKTHKLIESISPPFMQSVWKDRGLLDRCRSWSAGI